MNEPTSSPTPKPGANRHDHELETLRVVLSLPRQVVGGFSPRHPPEHVISYVSQAPKSELQSMLVDVLYQLRLRVHKEERQQVKHGRV